MSISDVKIKKLLLSNIKNSNKMALQQLPKRKRSQNWMSSEKNLLVELVAKHFSIVENKKTDAVSMKKKLDEWVVISNEYNSQTTYTHRTAENLKSQWENMKKAAKKVAANTRIEIMKTGGGPPLPKKEDPITTRILCLISTSAVGLFNPCDNDSVLPAVPFQDEQASIPVVHSEDFPETPRINYQDNPVAPIIVIDQADNDTENICETEDITINDWGDYTPQLLKTPVSAPLKTASNNKTRMSRRRPQAPALASIELLHKKKIEAIDLQKDLAVEESQNKSKISQLEIEIKKEILKQEKMKTRLILLELRNMKKKVNQES